jgi:hypothetical protein
MKRVGIASVLVGLALAGAPAHAFDLQQGGAGASAPKSNAPETKAGGESGSLSLSEQGKAGGGTEVRIPGLGKLGVLPKLDFGLELLYGAAEPKRGEEPLDRQQPDDGVVVRGTLKHRF